MYPRRRALVTAANRGTRAHGAPTLSKAFRETRPCRSRPPIHFLATSPPGTALIQPYGSSNPARSANESRYTRCRRRNGHRRPRRMHLYRSNRQGVSASHVRVRARIKIAIAGTYRSPHPAASVGRAASDRRTSTRQCAPAVPPGAAAFGFMSQALPLGVSIAVFSALASGIKIVMLMRLPETRGRSLTSLELEAAAASPAAAFGRRAGLS
jgi:hypothetical protein